MKINVLAKEENYLELELEGEDYSIPNALKELILEDDDVEFASCVLPHPQVSSPRLIVRTKRKNPLAVIRAALKKLISDGEVLKSALKKAK